ncbi:MAG: SDR family oxidoreductase [Candidatus Nanopelagicaceae bacterium]
MKRILVTGATGYVGGRLVRNLLEQGYQVRVFVRDEKKVAQYSWANSVEISVGNVSDYQAIRTALEGIDVAFYLLHSINSATQFDQIEREMAETFGVAAADSNIKQIVYLGGIANDKKTSRHLQSRTETGVELAKHGVPVLELRAGIIIGSGSASFEMLRHLTHRLPIMTTPKWVKNRTQPIAIRDVLYYLSKSIELPKAVSGVYDIGGPEVASYEIMMQKFAAIAGLRKRVVIKVPVLTPSLSSLWIGFVTPVPTTLARPLVESLISEVVVDAEKSIDKLIPKPEAGLTPINTAIELALEMVSNNKIETRWSDATSPTAPWQKAQGDPSWAGATEFKDVRVEYSNAPMENVWACIERIGGENGWYGSDWLWYLRGLLDRIFGGVGLRRGRRDPFKLRVGDSLDFWRVEEYEEGKKLRLYAEMILPGKAWLEFTLEEENGKTKATQVATFQPRGLGGQLYWRGISPFHTLLFPTMLRNICKTAAKESKK